MHFDRGSDSPMLFNACSLPLPSSSVHINPRALMLRFINVTFPYYFLRSTRVGLYFPCFLAQFLLHWLQHRRWTLEWRRASLDGLCWCLVAVMFRWQLWGMGSLEYQQKPSSPSGHQCYSIELQRWNYTSACICLVEDQPYHQKPLAKGLTTLPTCKACVPGCCLPQDHILR